MVAVRASTIVVGFLAASRGAEARHQMGAKFIQVYTPGRMTWSKKAVIFRNAPHTIENPHPGQIDVRVAFGHIASAAKGTTGLRDGLPPAAYEVKTRLKGWRSAYALAPEDYPSKRRRTVHTVEELEEMLAKAKKKVTPTPAGAMFR